MTNLPNILSRATNKPLLLEPGYARTFFSALAARAGIDRLYDADGEIHDREKMRVNAASFSSGRERDRPYQVVDGVAVLPVTGTLVNKYGYTRPMSGMTGYDGILTRAADAFGDPEVKGVLLDNDTPGGEVAGCFDCVRTLRVMSDAARKPLWALAYDMNASAGMALASAASRRLITGSGYAGSIGVIMAHGSYARQLDKQGIDVTLIYAGAHKADGNPYQSLPDDVYQRLSAELEKMRTEFAQLVADNLGLPVQTILDTEAQLYRGADAVTAGLADEVVNGNEAVRIFANYLSTRGRTITIGANMTQPTVNPSAQTPAPAPASEQTETIAKSEHETLLAEAVAGARMQERERIGAIVNSEAAKGREELAMHLATCTELAPADAEKVLSAAGQTIKPTTTGHKTALDMVMESQTVKSIGPDAVPEASTPDGVDVARMGDLYRKRHGIKQ